MEKASLKASKLGNAWQVAIIPDGRILLTEKSGVIGVIEHGAIKSEPYLNLKETPLFQKHRLLGLLVDPHFSENRYLYLMYAPQRSKEEHYQLLRYKEDSLTKKAHYDRHFTSAMASRLLRDKKYKVALRHVVSSRVVKRRHDAPPHAALLMNGTWSGSLLFRGLLDQAMHRAYLDPVNPSQIIRIETYLSDQLNRMCAIALGDDGKLYVGAEANENNPQAERPFRQELALDIVY